MPRPVAYLIAAVAVLLLALGAWLLFFRVTEVDRVEAALGDLISAVERKDPTGLERRLDDAYVGWGGDKQAAVETFRLLLPRFDKPNISTREMTIEVDPINDTATVRFEWTYTAVLNSDVQTVDTSRLPASMQPWEKATARFALSPEGEWRLVGVDTQLPRPR